MPEPEQARILLIDDDKDVREFLFNLLLAQRHSVIQASSPSLALEQFRQNPNDFDLVITDIVMPEMLGTDLAAKLQQLNPSIKILFISGNSLPDLKTIPLIEGSNFLGKPFRASEFFDLIKTMLK